MLKNKSAQSVTEYALLIMVVMAGIIIGGPYVIRSWNAYLKGWDSSIEDSYSDPLKESESGIPLPTCDNCRFEAPTRCGGVSPCCGGGCEDNETELIRICDPVNCAPPLSRCEPDPGCCVTFDTGLCAGNNIPPCLDGQMGTITRCGDVDTPGCRPETNCQSSCLNRPGNSFSCKELGELEDEEDLFSDTDYRVIPTCTPAKCEVVCYDTFVPTPDRKDCVCQAGQHVVPKNQETDLCPTGYCHQGSCPDGQFDASLCF